jgi:hypothetical protein
VGNPWLSIMLTLCHILHSVSHMPVLVYFLNKQTHPLPAVEPASISEHTNTGLSHCLLGAVMMLIGRVSWCK